MRLGALIPSAGCLTEPDMYRMAPAGVTAHFARVRFRGDSLTNFREMLEELPRACVSLSDARMDAYVFACTTGTMIDDGLDAEVVATINGITGRPATTTAAAVLEAFSVLRVRKIALATPYEDWLNEKECKFLERNGIQVVSVAGLGIASSADKAEQPLDKVYEFARSVDRADAQAIFISCAGFPAVELVDRLEQSAGKPVVTSNQASMWKLLRMCGCTRPVPGFGTLLSQH